MPTVRLSEELYGFLQERGNGETVDSTIRRLLDLDILRGSIVRKQVRRSTIAPREAYTWSILHSFGDDGVLLRKELQRRVGEYLRMTGLFDIYPADNEIMNHRQPRWKVRFGGALNYLKERGCVESVGEYKHNYQGGEYRIAEEGELILADCDLYIDAPTKQVYLTDFSEPELDDIGYPYPPKPLESWVTPGALVGRQKGKQDAEI